MNKNKVNKIINEMIETFQKCETENNRLYVETWVIGHLKMIQSKMEGGFNYFPSNATYRTLFKEFVYFFLCKNISESIEKETKELLITPLNVCLVTDLQDAMGL